MDFDFSEYPPDGLLHRIKRVSARFLEKAQEAISRSAEPRTFSIDSHGLTVKLLDLELTSSPRPVADSSGNIHAMEYAFAHDISGTREVVGSFYLGQDETIYSDPGCTDKLVKMDNLYVLEKLEKLLCRQVLNSKIFAPSPAR